MAENVHQTFLGKKKKNCSIKAVLMKTGKIRVREVSLFCYRHSLSLVSQIKGPSLAYGVVAMSSQGWSVAMFTSGSSRRGELSNIISVIGWFG